MSEWRKRSLEVADTLVEKMAGLTRGEQIEVLKMTRTFVEQCLHPLEHGDPMDGEFNDDRPHLTLQT